MGWQHKDIVSVLEAKRKARDAVYYQEKLKAAVCAQIIIVVTFHKPLFAMQKAKTAAAKQVPAEIQQTLAKLGY